MKKMAKVFAILMALGLCFVSCNNDVGSDSGSSGSSENGGNSGNGGSSGNTALATFVYTEDSNCSETIYFYSNNTWKCYENTYGYKDNDYNGTYSITSGDFTNGTMDFTVVDHNGDEKGWETVSVTITNGVFYIHVWYNPAWVDANDSSWCYNYIKK